MSARLAPDVYRAAQDRIVDVAGSLLGLPIDELLADIERSETLGPILDPTLYLRADKTLRQIKRLAVAARELQRVAGDVISENLGLPAGSVR